MAKVILERSICIGCGSCQALCPKYWEMVDDGKVNLLGSQKTGDEKYELEVTDLGCNQQATDACPVQCIHIEK
ncbi:MAG: ferredoxin [Candidatus Nealsonbacteria bacterium]|nr:ferredoxin [Candidatus Nealsonbacteria bacterium]